MKLITTLPPRSDGTIIVRDAAGKPLVFKADKAGVLVCDVDDTALCGRLLASGGFEPADAGDMAEAEALLKASSAGGVDDDDGEDGDDGADEAADGLPEEANTPPRSTARPRRRAS